jgi:hypothetical protein
MALAKRVSHSAIYNEGHPAVDHDGVDDKLQKLQPMQSKRRRRTVVVIVFVAVTAAYHHHFALEGNIHNSITGSGSGHFATKQPLSSSTSTDKNNLYPFFKSSTNGDAIEKVPFPTIPELENCTVAFQPPSPRRDEASWRKPFWIPSFSSSGAGNPTNKGDLSKDLIGKLTGLGDHKAVKNYHMSMKKRLKRCHGVSETVGCTQGHPVVPVQPETQTQNFQPKAIVFVRNFITAFPASLTDKNIAYHSARTQNSASEYQKLRDEWYQSTYESWKSLLEWWSTPSDGHNPYQIAMYVPFEDLMTTDRTKGRAILQQLSHVLRDGGFEATSLVNDFDCIWYTTVQEEWARQQSIMEYIPLYTTLQKEWIASQLQQYIEDASARAKGNSNDSDRALVSILTRYLHQAQAYAYMEK